MNKLDLIYKFINKLKYKKLLTLFIKNMFNYQYLDDTNYIFRMEKREHQLIIDIYDNVSNNRFNRYIFDDYNNEKYYEYNNKNIYVSYVFLKNLNTCNNLNKLAYLFYIDRSMIADIGGTFLDNKIINILLTIIK